MTTTEQKLARVVKTISDKHIERNALIAQMRAEGASLRYIAESAGMTHSGVAKILNA